MGNIHIITDSTSDIPAERCAELGIQVIPLKVLFGEETYLDGVTIGKEQFYEKLIASPVLPTTSQPSPAEFLEVYERILHDDPQAIIISIHLASVLSGTYQSGVIAKSMLDEQADVTVIDSKSASYGYGIQVVTAARMAHEGASKEAILAEVTRLQQELSLYFLVGSLEFLQKGGRIGKAAALFGSILNIKPILSLDQEGTVQSVDKVRGTKKAMQRIMEMLDKDFGTDRVGATIGWTHGEQTAKELAALLRDKPNVAFIDFITIGATVGTHVGPDTSAVFMYKV
ncbi:EDD domain protein [Paenibacillus sp. BIHB 4019]|uniref:EDD domain protein n=1 Tax=Paenibacillus sp. BIHB 4019 TaxID=1870819 RepID=A0A1B2DQ17_9BACL|nr:DegV family protein [Paenibacillus sp. BIHB 4019]ANY69790.1 EDD domain protein [Paenibacillus sp. BIHB 4019]